VAAALVAAVLVAAAPSGETAKRHVPKRFFGMAFDGPIRYAPPPVVRRQFARMASSGVESARTVFSWANSEPRRGATDLSATDVEVREAAAHGISVLPVVIGAPRWARRYPSRASSPPAHAADYARFLRKLVRRYGPRGGFWAENPQVPKRPIREWQIWNEPSLRYQWYRSPRQSFGSVARAYGSLLRASYRVVKRADRQATVVLAGLTNASWVDLGTLFSRGRIRRFFDVAAMNAYSPKTRNLLRIAALLRGALRRGGRGRAPLWVTEFTAPAARGRTRVPPGARTFVTTDRGMAGLLRSAYRAFATRGHRLGVRRAYWYTWASSYRGGGALGFFEFSGVTRYLHGRDQDRPALSAYRAVARRYEGCRKTTRASCR
jgi:polysaccharide biosynthesis protein PslG